MTNESSKAETIEKHPDFNQWLKTEDGLSCNDINTLAEQRYLTNRLFWAFDAGRNCVWDQYLEQKRLQEYSSIQNQELQRILAEEREIRKNNEAVMMKQYNELKSIIESLNTKP